MAINLKNTSLDMWNQSPALYSNNSYWYLTSWTTIVAYDNPQVPLDVDTLWLHVAYNPAGYGDIYVDNIRYTCSRPTLTLEIDPSVEPLIPTTEPGAYIFTVGDEIPLLAEVGVEGPLDITDTVRIELTVPRGLHPQGMTIQGEDTLTLDHIISILVCWVTDGSNCEVLLNEILEIVLSSDTVTYTYDIEGGVVAGQTFPITLDVVGELVGEFTINGAVLTVAPALQEFTASQEVQSFSMVTGNTVSASVQVQVVPMPSCEVTIASGRTPSYYATSLGALADNPGPLGSLTAGAVISVDLRAYANSDVVLISANSSNPNSVGQWFYSGAGNVTQTLEQQANTPCNVLQTEVRDTVAVQTELEQDFGVLLRREGDFVWTATEIMEIYRGVVITAAAFDRLSDAPLTTPALFRQIMTDGDTLPYIVLYKAVGTLNSREIAVAFTVPSGTGTASVAFGNNSSDTSDDITDGGCITFQGTGATIVSSPIPRTIVCNSLPITAGGNMILAGASGQTNLSFTQYLLVHELGHIFDNRTTSTNCATNATNSSNPAPSNCRLLNLAFQGLSSSACPVFLSDALREDNASTPPLGASPLVFRTTCVDVVDRRTFRVAGPRSDLNNIYARRDRGWGTGPDNIFTDFQQHPSGFFSRLTSNRCPSEDPLSPCYDESIVLGEEAADMFLNWVYRTLSDIPFTYLTDVPGTWNGFRNQSWGTYGPNTFNGPDDLYPGDARLEWMQIVMRNIFDEKGW